MDHDDRMLNYLQWALGGAIALYGVTSAALMGFISRAGSHHRAEINKLEAKVMALEQNNRSDDDKIWAAINKVGDAAAGFQAQILRDLAQLATRADLHEHERRMMDILNNSQRNGSD